MFPKCHCKVFFFGGGAFGQDEPAIRSPGWYWEVVQGRARKGREGRMHNWSLHNWLASFGSLPG